MKLKKSLGFYVVNVFAFLMMLVGMTLIVLEGLAHYRPYFTHKCCVLQSNWTVMPFVSGAVLMVGGGLILAYTVVSPALHELEGASPFIAELLNSVKLGGSRDTDKTATAAVTAETSINPDKDKP
jgi:hypothetical protein